MPDTGFSPPEEENTLHLFLTFKWFDLTAEHRKSVEYRRITPFWHSRIWARRASIQYVRFQRGYTPHKLTFRVHLIDIGTCPLAGWSGEFYRIHFRPLDAPPRPKVSVLIRGEHAALLRHRSPSGMHLASLQPLQLTV